MKIQLKKFPNGAHVVYENKDYIKKASRVRDHFCLVPTDDTDKEGKSYFCLYLHRDTYVEPLVSTTEI